MSSSIPHNTASDLTFTYGLVLVGVIITAGLWGMSCAQTNKSDGRYLGAMVVVLWVLDTVHFLFCIQSCWEILIPKFGDLGQFSAFPQGLMYQLFATETVTVMVQMFFLWRIWHFSHKSWIFPVLLIPVTLLETGACIAFLVKGLGQPASFFAEKLTSTLVMIIAITGGIVDIMIAVILGVMLWRSRTGLRESDRMISRLLGAVVGTGSCTAIFRIFLFIAIFGWPQYFLEFIAEIPLGTVYCNALLALLNSREYFRGRTVIIDASSKPLELSSVRLGSLGGSGSGSGADTATRVHEDVK